MDKAPFAIVSGEVFEGPQDLCLAYSELRQQLAAAIAERDRDAKDAARYREARLHVKAADVRNRIGRCDETRHADYLATVDAAIDAAIAAGGEGAGS